MQAVLLRKTARLERAPLKLSVVTDPEPGVNEILISVSACAVCRTDLHIAEGEVKPPKLPLILGHQVAGVVEKLGAKAKWLRKGDRVGIPWLYDTCGKCSFCKSGNENLCDEAKFTGLHVHGGYAEKMVVPEASAHRLPGHLSDAETAPLLCAGAIGMRALNLSGAEKGKRIGLYGFGASAHLVLQAALHLGCEPFVFTRSREHQKLAEKLGARWVGRAEEKAPEPLHCSIIFAPSGALVPLALAHLEKAGVLTLAGIHMSPVPSMSYSLLYHEKIIRSVANVTRKDVSDFLHVASKTGIRPRIETFLLKETPKAMQLLKEGKISGSGVVVAA